MGENITIYTHIDYVFEAYKLLCALTDDEEYDFSKVRETLLEKYGVDSAYVRDGIDLCEQIVGQAKQLFSDDMEQITQFFGIMEKDLIAADMVLCMDWANIGLTSQRSVQELRERYLDLSQAGRDAYFLRALVHEMEDDEFVRLVGSEGKGMSVPEAERIRHIFGYIQQMELAVESKVRIQETYLNRDSYMEQMTALLERAVAVIKEYESRIVPMCGEWGKYWGSIGDKEVFFEMMSQKLGIDWEDHRDFCLIPSVIHGNAMYIFMDDDVLPGESRFRPVCRIGLWLTKDLGFGSEVKEDYRAKQVQRALKVLGDKSKFDILLLIKDRPFYGSEIAKQLSLTTATVSHHMNMLLQMKLILVEQRDGKMYYRANKEELGKLFEECIELFR